MAYHKREAKPCDTFRVPHTQWMKPRTGRAALRCNICGWRREAHAANQRGASQ